MLHNQMEQRLSTSEPVHEVKPPVLSLTHGNDPVENPS